MARQAILTNDFVTQTAVWVLNYFTPNESSTASYSFYLGRQDTVYMNKFGEFIFQYFINQI